MKKIVSLSTVFIKEFYQNLPVFDIEKKKFNKKSIFFWLMAIIFFGITYLSYEIIKFLSQIGQPEIFLNLYFFMLAILLLFQTILICANLFFFSKDMEKVLYMPLKPIELLLAKFNSLLCMLYITEGIFGLIPLTFYGLLTHAYFVFYFWEIIILAIFPILLITIVSTVVFMMMRLGRFIRNKDIFQIIITLILITLFCILESTTLQGLFEIKNDEQAIQQFGNFSQRAQQIGKYFFVINPSVTILSNPVSNMAVISFFQLVFYNIVGGIIFILVGKFTYLKDIVKNVVSSNHKKKKPININKEIKYHKRGISYILKEIKMLVREPIFFMQCVFPVIIILITGIIIIVALLPIIAKMMQEETIKVVLQNLSFNMEIVCGILVILQVLFSISNISLTAISREGKNATLIKYIPIKLYQQFLYKCIPQIILNLLVSVVAVGMILYLIPNMNVLYLFLIFIIATFINLINSYLMLVVDLRRPNLDWNTEYSVVKKSDNKLFQYVFMIINVIFLMYISNILKHVNLLVALIGEVIIFAILFIIIDRAIKKWQNQLFNKII